MNGDPLAPEAVIGPARRLGQWVAHLSAVGVIAAIDYATGPDIELSAIDLVPILSAGYRGGRALSMTIAVAAATAWYVDSELIRSGSGSMGVLAWNGLSRLAIYVSLALAVDELRRQNRRVVQLATTDHLTGLPNARTFSAQLRSEVLRGNRYGHPVALLLVDCDDLKRINDTDGHAAGNDALREVARVLGATVRGPDIAARWGGDEFAVLQPETTLGGAQLTATRIRESIKALPLTTNSGTVRELTVSIGIAVSSARDPGGEAALFQAADRALYDAKHSGKDRSCAAPPHGHATER